MDDEKENLPLFGEISSPGRELPTEELQPREDEVSEVPAEPLTPRPGRYRYFDLPESSLGDFLRELRERNTLSIDDLAEETRIKGDNLRALEGENYSLLPQPVYILGYVRKLCALYGVPRDRADLLTAGLREKLEYELPDDINKSVIDREVSEENERKMRQLALFFTVAALLIAAVRVMGGVLLLMNLRKQTPAVRGPIFESSQLMELQGKPVLKISELSVP